MAKLLIALAALVAPAAGYIAPAAPGRSSYALQAKAAESIEGAQAPLGAWDPLCGAAWEYTRRQRHRMKEAGTDRSRPESDVGQMPRNGARRELGSSREGWRSFGDAASTRVEAGPARIRGGSSRGKALAPSRRNLADTTEFGPTLEWYRAAELKHGRVAMAAFVGFIVTANGFTWPGSIAPGVTWKSCVGATPLDTWDNLPMYGKYQIIAWVGLMVICTEMQKPHYLAPGGKLGECYFDPVAEKYSLWDPLATMKSWDADKRARGRLVELQNGRAAMFGVIGFVMGYKYEGTVPALNFLPKYAGELPGAPFAADWHVSETASAWAW